MTCNDKVQKREGPSSCSNSTHKPTHTHSHVHIRTTYPLSIPPQLPQWKESGPQRFLSYQWMTHWHKLCTLNKPSRLTALELEVRNLWYWVLSSSESSQPQRSSLCCSPLRGWIPGPPGRAQPPYVGLPGPGHTHLGSHVLPQPTWAGLLPLTSGGERKGGAETPGQPLGILSATAFPKIPNVGPWKYRPSKEDRSQNMPFKIGP